MKPLIKLTVVSWTVFFFILWVDPGLTLLLVIVLSIIIGVDSENLA